MHEMDPDEEAVPFGEFLALARDEGLIALDVQVVQAPSEANGRGAVVLVTARSAQASFAATGEASPRSAPEAWHPFLVTLAELRAKARALRDLTGLEHAVQEELSVPYASAAASDEPPVRPMPMPQQSRSTVPPTRPATPSPSRPPAPTFDEDTEEEEDEEEPEAPAPPQAMAPRPAPAPVPAARPDDDLPPDHDAIDPEMIAKLKKLAISIADLEGTDLSDAEAIRKLDDFFTRAFKHPLSRATRLEGQRVVQRLSSQLVQLRSAANADKE
jgi:hypothetical protein